MNKKISLIALVIITSLVGLSGGFVIAKSIALNKATQASALNAIADVPTPDIQIIPTPTEIQEQTTLVVPKIDPAPIIPAEKPKVSVSVSSSSCPKPKKEYEDESYLDVGQDVSLDDKSYTPDGLVDLDNDISKYKDICIKEEVADALNTMTEEAKKGGYDIVVSSGFRDYNTQKSIMDTNIKAGNKNATKLIAKPGYSEHQLGVAVDLTSKSIAYASATGKFGDTPESTWLEAHASEYGFIQSYPKGKEDITGYLYEPWHYRYVGIENAREIMQSDQTLNQYLKAKKDLTLK